jgi:hypothetical protein
MEKKSVDTLGAVHVFSGHTQKYLRPIAAKNRCDDGEKIL